MMRSARDVPMFVAAPTELVAIPAINSGAARPAVVRVKIPPAMVKEPPTTLVEVPTVLLTRHLEKWRFTVTIFVRVPLGTR